MVLTNYYLRVTPFTNADVADKLQLKPFKKSQPFRSTIQPYHEGEASNFNFGNLALYFPLIYQIEFTHNCMITPPLSPQNRHFHVFSHFAPTRCFFSLFAFHAPPKFLFYFEATNSLFSYIYFQLDQTQLFST